MKSYDDLLVEYKQLAKQADMRLKRLEDLAARHEEHYENVLTFAYATAMRNIRSWSGPDAKRFYAGAPKNVQQLQAKINDIKTFLHSKTSRKRDITAVYKQKATTTNAIYGTNFTWQELANYYESDISALIDAEYGSDTTIRALGSIKRIANNPEKIKAAIEGKLRLANNDIVNEKAMEMLSKYGSSITGLFSK